MAKLPPPTRDRRPPASPLRAVLVGLAVDIGGSALTGVLLSLGHALSLAASGLSEAQVREAMANVPPASGVAVLGMLIGAACSVAGGYVCARLVQRDEWRVGAAMAALSVVASLFLGGAADPADMVVLGSLSTAACVMLGVMYGRGANRRPPPGSKG
jgi:hypothetical protein